MWMYQSREDKSLSEAIAELDTASDRAAAIVATALVEDHLTTVLKGSLHQDEKIQLDMFRGSGPLGSFSSKINLAFLTGLLSARACKELHTIREIRNEFAHKLGKLTFESQRLRDLAMNLTLPDWYDVTIEIPNAKSGEKIKFSLVEESMREPNNKAGLKNPRTRFLITCRLFLGIFTLNPKVEPPTPRV
jgi:hypothetical protein